MHKIHYAFSVEDVSDVDVEDIRFFFYTADLMFCFGVYLLVWRSLEKLKLIDVLLPRRDQQDPKV